MARPKIPRKSTFVDMTAMCDVAFLLLSFFILTTKFKPSEAVPVDTPNSVASKIAPENDVIMVSLNNDNKVFLSAGDSKRDKDNKREIISNINSSRNLGLTEAEMNALVKAPFIGVSLGQLKQQARMQTEQMTGKSLPGIPVMDTSNNELLDWMRAVAKVYQGQKVTLLLKGDNVSKYPAFKNIITAFTTNDFFKFQMVTNPESVPRGSDLYKSSMAGQNED